MLCQRAAMLRNNVQHWLSGAAQHFPVSVSLSAHGAQGWTPGNWRRERLRVFFSLPSVHVSCDLYISGRIKETPSLKPTSLCCLSNQHEHPRLFVLRTLPRTAMFQSGNWLWCHSHCSVPPMGHRASPPQKHKKSQRNSGFP